jgi:hypothetical protein
MKKNERRERSEMRRSRIDIEVSSCSETERRNQMTLKAAYII